MTELLINREAVRRFEAAEAGYYEAKLRGLQADDGRARGVELARLGQTRLLSIQSRRQNPSYNRALGFSKEDAGYLDEILAWLRARADAVWVDVAPALADGGVMWGLVDAELKPTFALNFLYHELPPREGAVAVQGMALEAPDLQTPRDLRAFAAVYSAGFGVPTTMMKSTRRSARLEYGAPGWRTFLATVDGEPASMAAMHITATTASIDAMATVPRHRRRGCQTALLHRCVEAASAAGCEVVLSQTEPSSGSERNMVRAGFRVAYTKMLFSHAQMMR